ncbi:uracil-DNA glycosylase family protein [Phycisphaera mikurensis]|uniref:Putative DNA glycosylase n=1 Tax=Phycisphaera mikurensis (strain NBRC 102666 / KCTC 22515 / FYK2301M01) TaxID=1142394 RepID=I0IGJ3_PHYMF|nr:uracil-DNA glycosylase family protein [Phycisphaera mikurensis]MBB6442937.1 DNA polymerase [Phycisphaera mikurensis]BAM04381.1 putative DNA glycosylase [Phycisphaera mikurensis NBRC 102666]
MEAERAARVLRQFLETDRLMGVESVPLRRPAAGVALPAAAREDSAPSAPPLAPAAARAGRSNPPPPPPPAAAAWDLGGGTPAEKLAALAAALAEDPDLAERLRGQPPVLGSGGLPARVLFVNEPPASGAEADEAAKLLDGMVNAMKLASGDVFRCPCLPFKPAGGGHPSPAELAAGAGALQAQLRLAAPEVVVAMGGAAAKALLGEVPGITRLRGVWTSCGWTDPPVPVMPTLSPAFVLRSYTRDNRMMVWEDLKRVMEKLEDAAEAQQVDGGTGGRAR